MPFFIIIEAVCIPFIIQSVYSDVPNKRAARLLIFHHLPSNFMFIVHYITIGKSSPRLLGTIEYLISTEAENFNMNKYQTLILGVFFLFLNFFI